MKKLTAIIILTILVTLSSLSFGATLNSMSKAQVEEAFVNKTSASIMTGNLKGRTIINTFSTFLDDHGNIFGKMAHKSANEPQTDKGVYSIQDDGTLRVTWQHWHNAKQVCIHMFNTQNAYIAIDCTDAFHNTFMKEMIQPGNHLD